MIKIKLISDLHVDVQNDGGRSLINSIPKNDHDITVVAGDLCQADDTEFYFEAVALLADRFKQVILVSGNHEYWGGQAQAIDMAIDETANSFSNVVRLKPGFPEKFNGVNFHGGTLWYGPDTIKVSHGGFPDFLRIGNFTPWVFKQHQAFIDMFENNMVQPGDVVISHHMPSYACVQPQWNGYATNRFFANNMDKYIIKYQPAAWLFGHTHDYIDMKIDNTRAICNPFGYLGEYPANVKFNDKLVIEIGE